MNAMIEKLKDTNYVRAFGLMKPEEQDVLESVGWMNRLVYIPKKWYPDGDKIKYRERTHLTFCIKPGYQPEPEFVDYLIEVCDGEDGDESDLKSFLGVKHKLDNNPILPREHTYLYALPSLPNFECFWYDDIDRGRELPVAYQDVANRIDKKDTVFARFRTGGGN